MEFTILYHYVYLGLESCELKRQDEEIEYFDAGSWDAAKEIARERFCNALPSDYNASSFCTSANLYLKSFNVKEGDISHVTFSDPELCKRARIFFGQRELPIGNSKFQKKC